MPDFWRKEWWHPLTVHFPIALLLVATLFLIIVFFLKGEGKIILQKSASVLLVIGSAFAWISLYTGDMADGIVSRKICDPTVLKDHEIASQTMTYLFSGAAVIQILLFLNFLKSSLKQFSAYLILILMLAGSVFLIRTAHLGATVVYQQGAGVYNHVVDCDEYE